ncbi:hypothetical protein ES319_D10G165500v1 [Gossypium barbadense]|uniref:Uncharacterized protein n=3 Tax=Gossypium TaxID=3633 RepID=A0A5J5PVC0_GOSBA|nr:hypothetical protein ES319_D10G165500v1 [Gossypium barbadense]KAB2009422.1 hypothetical protein ES319_D10G165500v1 [Gossypium barbadense]TYG50460.1 hypothetical protein ES288_D10G177100v1 [Gossypium darwinii]
MMTLVLLMSIVQYGRIQIFRVKSVRLHQAKTLVLQAAAMVMMQQQMMMYPHHHYMAYNNHHYHYQQYQQQQQQQQKQQQGCNLDEVKTIWVGDLVHWMDETYLHGCFSHTGEIIWWKTSWEILSMKFRISIYYTAMLLTKEMVIGSMMHMNSRMAVMDGPLEPSSSTAPSVADVPDGPAFVNFFSVCIFLFNFCPLITCNTFQYI